MLTVQQPKINSLNPTTMTMSKFQTLALSGATDGTNPSALRNSLKNWHQVRVLVRSLSKLSSLSPESPTTLHLIPGDVHDILAIKSTLVTEIGKLVDIDISAIGIIGRKKRTTLVFEDQKVCEEGRASILKVLGEIEKEERWVKKVGKGPKIVVFSTMGISDAGGDLPISMTLVNNLLAKFPNVDKSAREKIAKKIQGRLIIVRSSYMGDEEEKGLENERVGVEGAEKGFENMETGYAIWKEDIGL